MFCKEIKEGKIDHQLSRNIKKLAHKEAIIEHIQEQYGYDIENPKDRAELAKVQPDLLKEWRSVQVKSSAFSFK